MRRALTGNEILAQPDFAYGADGQILPALTALRPAQDDIRRYLAQGFSEKEALAMVAMDPGMATGAVAG